MTDRLTDAKAFLLALPHAQSLGMQLVEMGDGKATIAMPYDPRLIGDPLTGVLHGGAISALMDTASGASVLCHPAAPLTTATLDLRIDYMRPATPGQTVTAHAVCHHVTRTVAFIRVTATDADTARPVAMGTGTFTLDRPPVDRLTAEGQATEGQAAEGLATERLATDELAMQGVAIAARVEEGLATQEWVTLGLATEGQATERLAMDGLATAALATEGLATEGLVTEHAPKKAPR